MIEDSKRETIVFAYDTEDERRAIMALFHSGWHDRTEGPRIVGMSNDSELTRINLIQEAVERYSDHYDLRDAIEEIMQHPNLTRFKWADIEDAESAYVERR